MIVVVVLASSSSSLRGNSKKEGSCCFVSTRQTSSRMRTTKKKTLFFLRLPPVNEQPAATILYWFFIFLMLSTILFNLTTSSSSSTTCCTELHLHHSFAASRLLAFHKLVDCQPLRIRDRYFGFSSSCYHHQGTARHTPCRNNHFQLKSHNYNHCTRNDYNNIHNFLLPISTTNTKRRNIPFLSSTLLQHRQEATSLSLSNNNNIIDYQSDTTKYGRGEMHLSAMLCENDVVVYQTGQWEVDGVVVGDENELPTYKYAKIETIQIVWTHNCEHGVLRGIPMKLMKMKITDDDDDDDIVNNEDKTQHQQQILIEDWDDDEDCEMIEFGPEQLVARLPVKWLKQDSSSPGRMCVVLTNINNDLLNNQEEEED